jgi:Ca2+-binding RTX toxin-like protein
MAVANDDGTVTYTPNQDATGADSFTYEVCDKGATPQCDEATVDVQITPVSDDTITRPDSYEVNEDGVLNVAAPGVLENDEDPDGPLTAVVTRETYMGTLVLYPDGSFTYTPNADFSGNDFFFYRANDTSPDGGSDETSVSINVLPVEEPAACNDGRDNDGDGKRDLRDPGCDNRRDDSERNSAPDNGGQPACTIKGSDRANTLRGTANRDVICGRGGNDTIRGMGGNDLIFGNGGNDNIQGNGGDDTIYGGGGEDNIQGNDGNDRIYGGEKGDLLQGNDGRDTIRGGGGDDTIQGGAGDDDIDGGVGNDTTQQ